MSTAAAAPAERDALAAMRIWVTFAALTRRGSARWAAPAAVILAGEFDRAAARYPADDAADAAVKPAQWAGYLDRVWLDMVPAGGLLIGNWIGEPRAEIFEPAARTWLRANGAERVAGIAETSRHSIDSQIRQGVAARESAAEIAARIRRAKLSIVPGRSQAIAGTEVHSATNYGSYVAAVDSRAVELKIWLATPDGRARDAHIGASGQKRELSAPFSVGGENMMYPGSPGASAANTVNCRCVMGYAVVERRRPRAA
jgi:hypothetical protein